MILTSYEFTASGGRMKNDDSVASCQREGAYCFTLCDGLGGHMGGEVASRCVCDTMERSFLEMDVTLPLEQRLKQGIVESQAALIALQAAQGAYTGLRTTLCCLMLDEEAAAAAYVGDSRIYQFRGGRILAHTNDHSVSQRLANIGEIRQQDVRRHEDRNLLLRCMGQPWETPQFEMWQGLTPVQPGDAFLLCSDGLWEWVEDVEMEGDLAAANSPREWIEAMCRRVAALSGQTRLDNYSAIGIWIG